MRFCRPRTRRPRSLLLVLLAALLPSFGAADAQSWDPFPELEPGRRLSLGPAVDPTPFRDTDDCLRRQTASGADFFAAVVAVSDARGRRSAEFSDAVPYVDALYQAWRRTDRLDADTHVLIAVSLENRGIAVHPGIRWADLGFEGSKIRRVIDGSRFGDLARSGELGRALCELARTVDLHLAETEARQRREAEAAQRRQIEAEARRGMIRAAVPFVVLGAILLLLLLVVAVQWLRVRGARRESEALIRTWRERLDHTADRLLDVETRHPLYFRPDFKRWIGASHELDRQCAEAVNRVYLLYSKANLLVDRAETASAELRLSRLSGLDAPVRLLQETPIRLGDEDPESLRLQGASTPELDCRADELLDRLERFFDDLDALLSEVTAVAERFWELAQEADVAAGEASAACEARAALGSPTEALSRDLEPILASRREAMDASDDPVAANPRLEEVVGRLAALRDRAISGNETLKTLRGPAAERAEALDQRLVEMAEDGFELDEPGFVPRLWLDQGLRRAVRIEQAVADGEETEAADLLDELRADYEELDRRLDVLRHTRERLPEAVRALETDAQALRQRIPAVRAVLLSLENEHDPETFGVESDNLDELDQIFASFTDWCREIRDDHAAQHYLAASQDMAEGTELVRRGGALLDELEAIETELRATRERTRELAGRCRRSGDELRTAARGPGVGSELSESCLGAVELLDRRLQAAEAPRPHWPRLEDDLTVALTEIEALAERVEQDVKAFARARNLEEELTREVPRLHAEVKQEQRDRPHVEEAVSAVARSLAGWRLELAGAENGPSPLGGGRLEDHGTRIADQLARARDAWRSEMDLVRLAESKLAAARHRLRAENGRNHGYGVVASCSEAERLLAAAPGLRERRQWQELLELCGRAEDQITAEVQRCHTLAAELEARERERRLARQRAAEQESRRRAAALAAEMAARVAVAALSSGSRSSSSGFGRSSRSGRRGGFSGGSSFGGGSRSGGSSW